MTTPAVLRATDVSVTIDGQALLHPVSLAVGPGEALAVRGRNGAGKTTLLRVLCGLTAPTTGTVHLHGAPFTPRTRQQRRAHIAALIGLPPFAGELTLDEHLRLIATSWGSEPAEAGDAATRILTDLSIPHLARRFPHELSSGQTQLFALATALARPGEVLILDEPEQRLDAERQALAVAAIRARRDAGAAVVFASHSPPFVEALATASIRVDGA